MRQLRALAILHWLLQSEATAVCSRRIELAACSNAGSAQLLRKAIMVKTLFRSISFFAASLCLVATVVSALSGQTPQQPKPDQNRVSPAADQGSEQIFTRRVRLPITVTDKKGQLVTGLTRNDFLILEDKIPQTIDGFDNELSNKLPLYIAVLMDTSASTAGKLKFEQESAMNFVQTVVRPRRDRVLFATFDDHIKLHQDFTDKLDLLDRAVFGIKET